MIKLDGVVKKYSGVTALGGVNLTLDAGQVVGLIGPNGSGKTTLLGIASGVLSPTAGEITVNGKTMTGKGPTEFAHNGVGRTFQEVRLFAGLTVAETVQVGAVAKGLDPESAVSAMDHLELGPHASREATTLSYGLQRRVEIARALAGQPNLLFLDEPAAGMNESESDDLMLAIRRVAEELGCGVLIVDHDLHLIMQLCERVHVLCDGETLAEDTPERIQANQAVIESYIGTKTTGDT